MTALLRPRLPLSADIGNAQFAAQLPEILDNAIMHDADIRADMRMRVIFAWPSMRCPAGVADADPARKGFGDETKLQIFELAARPPLHSEDLINEHIKSASQNAIYLNAIQTEALFDCVSPASRTLLGKAAQAKKEGWFKSVTWMEDVARDIVGPDLENADSGFKLLVDDIFAWASNASR
jgi:hypothetical protein